MNKITLNRQKEKHSTLSLRRATPRHRRCTAFRTYFYPRPPCGERLTNKRLDERERNFYPRSPCGERPLPQGCPPSQSAFLSTLSLRRATHYLLQAASRPCYFYPRSPCGERLPQNPVPLGDHYISIHALLAESDLMQN